MEIYRPGTTPTNVAPESTFTGDVQIGGYFSRMAPSRLAGASVVHAPRARTPWKTNPCGQTLIVTSGVGWTQTEGEAIVEIRAGDRIWYPPGTMHWDGATPEQAMSCVVVQEFEGGSSVRFLRSVTDEEYQQGPPAASNL